MYKHPKCMCLLVTSCQFQVTDEVKLKTLMKTFAVMISVLEEGRAGEQTSQKEEESESDMSELFHYSSDENSVNEVRVRLLMTERRR